LIPTHEVAAMFVDAGTVGEETRVRREAILKNRTSRSAIAVRKHATILSHHNTTQKQAHCVITTFTTRWLKETN